MLLAVFFTPTSLFADIGIVSFTASGQDDGPTTLTVTPADLASVHGSTPIDSIKITNAGGELTNTYCGNWYDFTLKINAATVIANGCASDFNGYVIPNTFTSFVVNSNDLDAYSDAVTIAFDVTVYFSPSCSAPSNTGITGLTPHTVQFNWTSGGSTNYNVEYGVAGFTLGTGTVVSVVTDTFLVVNTLSSDTEYDWYVQDSCGVNDLSVWTAGNSFTTLISCHAPTNDIVTDITTVSAQLNWTSGGSSNYNVEYGINGFTRGTGTVVNVVSDTFAIVSGLSNGTVYDWYVQDSCGVGDVSVWKIGGTFVTSCNAITSFPYTENFDSNWYGTPSAPLCWTVINADGDSYTWSRANNYITPTHSPLYAAHGMGNADDYLITPQMTLSPGTEIRWWDNVESASKVNTYDVLLSTTGNDTASFTVNLGTINCANTDWLEHSLDLSAYTGNVYIAFHQTASAATNYGFGIDDFTARVIPQNEVEVLEVLGSYGAIGTDDYAVKVVVKNNGMLAQTNLPMNYKIQGSTAVSETMASLASMAIDTFTFSTLLTSSATVLNSELAIYSSLSNDENLLNDTVYTNVTSYQLPFNEGFEGLATNDIPNGWTSINTTSSAYATASANVSSSYANTGSVSFKLYNSGETTGDIIGVFPKDNTTSGVSAKYLSLWVKGGTSQNLIVGVFTDPSDLSTFVGVDTLDCPSTYTEFVVDLSSYTGSGKYVAFKHDFAGTYDTYYIDDIQYYEPLQNDVMVSSIDCPSEIICGTTTFAFDAIFSNNGLLAQNNVTVSAMITNPNGVITTLNANSGSLVSLSSDTVSFSPVDVSVSGIYTIKVYSALSTDQDVSNDTLVTTLELLAPLAVDHVETFETLANWTSGMSIAYDNSNPYMYKNLYNTSNTVELGMIKKIGPISAGDNLVFDYRIHHYNNSDSIVFENDSLFFMVSNDCGSTFDTLYVVDANVHTGTVEWTNVQLPLTSYIGDYIIIAFSGVWGGAIAGTDYDIDIDNYGVATTPMVSLGMDTTVCANDTVLIDAGYTSGYNYMWTLNNDTLVTTDNTIDATEAGVYTVQVTNPIGMAYDTVMVMHNALPTVSFTGLDTVYCASAMPVMLVGTPAAGTYTGMGMIGASFDPYTAGAGNHVITYSFTDNNGCSNDSMLTTMVNAAPVAVVNMGSEICEGESVVLNASAMESAPSVIFATYIEGSSNNKGLEIYNASSKTVNLDNYRIAQASNGNGWAYYHTFPVGTTLAPNASWIMITDAVDTTMFDATLADEVLGYPSLVHGNGDDARAIEYTTDGGATWMMTDIIGDPDNDPGSAWDVAGVTNATKDHSLYRKANITNGSINWASIAGTDSVSSEYIVLPKNDFSALGNHMVTPDTLSGSYLWSNGATTSEITVMPTTTTTYYVTVSVPNMDCDDYDSVTIIVNPMPVVDLGSDVTIKWTAGSINLDAANVGATYLWSTGETTQITTYDNTNLANNSTNTISVTVDLNGCVASDEIVITMQDDVSIGESFENANVSIYPNPTNGLFNMTIEGFNGELNMQVINVTGEVVYTESMNANAKITKSFDVSEFAAGVYYVRLSNDNGIVVKKLIIK